MIRRLQPSGEGVAWIVFDATVTSATLARSAVVSIRISAVRSGSAPNERWLLYSMSLPVICRFLTSEPSMRIPPRRL
jgi:hypothetical protein